MFYKIFPNNNIPYPASPFANHNSKKISITDYNYTDDTLKISIDVNVVDNNILSDNSGNNNFGFNFSDYRPDFDDSSLKPNKTKYIDLVRISKYRRSF